MVIKKPTSPPDRLPPIFLTHTQIDELHDACIRRFGGSTGTRDHGILDSAIAMPAAQFAGQFLHTDLFEMAAAYLFHLCQNHPYVDGNKRVALSASLTFLYLNGLDVDVSADELESLTLAVAKGQRDKPAIADFYREHTTRLP